MRDFQCAWRRPLLHAMLFKQIAVLLLNEYPMAFRFERSEANGIETVLFLEMFDPENPGKDIERLAAELKCPLRLYEFADDWNPTSDDVRNLAAMAGKFIKIPDSKIAVVACSELLFGLVRMYAGYRESNPGIPELKVFRSREDALLWLQSFQQL